MITRRGQQVRDPVLDPACASAHKWLSVIICGAVALWISHRSVSFFVWSCVGRVLVASVVTSSPHTPRETRDHAFTPVPRRAGVAPYGERRTCPLVEIPGRSVIPQSLGVDLPLAFAAVRRPNAVVGQEAQHGGMQRRLAQSGSLGFPLLGE